jgi:hypothetical protein
MFALHPSKNASMGTRASWAQQAKYGGFPPFDFAQGQNDKRVGRVTARAESFLRATVAIKL